MKSRIFTIVAGLALAAGTMTAANAVEFDVGPGGVYVGPGYHHHRYYRDYDRDCRVIVDHHINRYGERVVVRRRVCED